MKLIKIDDKDYYFKIKFVGDAITPCYEFTMYQKQNNKLIFFKWSSYKCLISRNFHESEIDTFHDSCMELHRIYSNLMKKWSGY